MMGSILNTSVFSRARVARADLQSEVVREQRWDLWVTFNIENLTHREVSGSEPRGGPCSSGNLLVRWTMTLNHLASISRICFENDATRMRFFSEKWKVIFQKLKNTGKHLLDGNTLRRRKEKRTVDRHYFYYLPVVSPFNNCYVFLTRNSLFLVT